MGPTSEEMMEREQDQLIAIHERLGDSEQARLLRARHQSAQLRSDMQAFKAANPSCILEDFVRWHSPRDWIVDGEQSSGINKDLYGTNGKLSERFDEPNNLWVVLWGATLPVAASQQALQKVTTPAGKRNEEEEEEESEASAGRGWGVWGLAAAARA